MSGARDLPAEPSSRLSVAVMAHPARLAMAEDLRARLDGPSTLVLDRVGNEWDTARRSLLARDPDADYHLVVQDDAVACLDLLAGLARALDHAPDGAVVSVYAGRVRKGPMGRALDTADRWVLASRLWWGVAAVYPVGIIDRLVAGCDGIAVVEYDRRVSSWLRRKGVPVAYTVPSLVDHRDGPSLLSHDRPEPRRAARFLGEAVSALDLDWASEPVVVSDPRAPAQQPRRVSRRPVTPVVRP